MEKKEKMLNYCCSKKFKDICRNMPKAYGSVE